MTRIFYLRVISVCIWLSLSYFNGFKIMQLFRFILNFIRKLTLVKPNINTQAGNYKNSVNSLERPADDYKSDANLSNIIIDNKYRTEYKDKIIQVSASYIELSNGVYIRLTIGPKHIKLSHVNFKYSVFDSCYMKNTVFESCDFTGCRFIGSNLVGSSFNGCTFDYVIFERTFVDDDILQTQFYSYDYSENIQQKFARSLRVNYQQIGDVKSANKAIMIEIEATRKHLWHLISSPFFLKKYPGIFNFIKNLIRFLTYEFLHLIWGNGESLKKLLFTTVFLLFIITTYLVHINEATSDIVINIKNSFSIFMGVSHSKSDFVTALITATRLILFGMFMVVLLKKVNRR